MQLVNQNLPTHSVSLLYTSNDVNIKLDLVKYVNPEYVLKKGLKTRERLDYKDVVVPLSELDQETMIVPKTKEQVVELLS